MERSSANEPSDVLEEKKERPAWVAPLFRLKLFSPYHLPVSVKVTARVFPLVEVIRPKLVESKF